MRKIKEVLRLKWANDLSDRKIAQSCNISRPAVANYVERAEQAGLSWPLPDTLTDAELEQLLFPTLHKSSDRDRVPPDLLKVHQELQKKNVTLFLLWQEYREQHPKGYQYSWFCDQYRNWLGTRDLSMRQTHRAGEKLFVDYAGQTLPVIDPRTGEIRSAQIFVAVLGLPITPMLKPPGRNLYRTGLVLINAASPFLAACLNWLSPITCAQASPKRAFMSPT